MKVIVGSKNPNKIEAVRYVIRAMYPDYASFELEGKEANSEVSDQPKSLEETIKGAYNRSQQFADYNTIGFGIESGVFELPNSMFNHTVLDVCACVISKYRPGRCLINVGLSSAWSISQEMDKLIMYDGMDMNAAANWVGLTDDPKIGYGEGAIGLLSEGRLTRSSYTEQAVLAAMIGWHNRFGKLI